MREFIDADRAKEQLLSVVDLDPSALVNHSDRPSFSGFAFKGTHGFLTRPIMGNTLELAGFCTPDLEPGTEPPEYLWSVTELADLPPEKRTIDANGKGVGYRIYNTWFAALCHSQDPRAVTEGGKTRPQTGFYSVKVNPGNIWYAFEDHDLAQTGLGKIREHARKRHDAKVRGLNAVVDDVHARMEPNTELAVWNCPPRALLRGAVRAARELSTFWPPSTVQPRFAVVRSAAIALQRLGVVNH